MKDIFLISISILGLAVLPACQTLPASQAPKTVSQKDLPPIPLDWAMLAETGRSEPVNWIAALDDPKLTALVKEAIAKNPNLEMASANLDKARALARQAGAALKPQIGAGLSTNSQGSGQGRASTTAAIGIDISWEADLWGRLGKQETAALQNMRAAQADYRGARNLIAASTAQAYCLLLEADAQIAIAKSVVDSRQEIRRIVRLRSENGMATQQDMSLAEADLANARNRLIAIKGAKRTASRALETLIGRYPSASLFASKAWPALPALPSAGIPSDLLERRPDLVAAEARIGAALDQRDVARLAKLPRLSLTGALGGASTELENILSPQNLAWQAASSLLLPVFKGGALDAQVDIASADVQLAVSNYVDIALQAFSDVETRLDQSSVLKDRQMQIERAVEAAQNARNIATLRYQEGESDLLDVLTIEQRYAALKSESLSVRRSRLSEYISLCLALGGDWNKG